MDDLGPIEAKLVGPAQTRQRRADLLAELGRAFAEAGPPAVTEDMKHRMDELEADFENKLTELRKQL
jgi:hypothetical protein